MDILMLSRHSDVCRRQAGVRLTLVLAIVALLAGTAVAQPSMAVSVGRSANTAAEGADVAGSRQTTAAIVDVEQSLAGERLRLFYGLDAGTFSTPGDWSSFLHVAGGTWRAGSQDRGRTAAFLGATGTWRANGSSWSEAGFRAIQLRANVETRPGQAATLRVGYAFERRWFPELAVLDQSEHDWFGSVLLNFQTRTTVIGELHVGAKLYRPVVESWAPSIDPVAGTGRANGPGRGMGPGLRGTLGAGSGGSITTVSDTGAGQVTVLARIAQSLADRTGVSVQYSRRQAFGAVPPVIVTTPATFFDDGVYDDPFASRGQTWWLRVRHGRESGLGIDAAASWMGRGYRATTALDADGAPLAGWPLRNDRIWRGSAGVDIPLLPARTGPVGFTLNLGYAFTRHRSNDVFYNYTSHTVAVGATVAY